MDAAAAVVARRRPERQELGPPPPRVQPLAWTPAEWATQAAKANPIVADVERNGVWLRGALEDVASSSAG